MADPIRVIVNGASGRMGRTLVRLVHEADDLVLSGALERPDHPDLGRDAGAIAGVGELGVPLAADLGPGDVLIDFSHPDSTAARAEECAGKGIALVIGTTGLTDDHLERIEKAAERVACLRSANMSVGIALATRIVADLAAALPDDYDIEIIEAHHRHKKDAPSGTAFRLARAAARARGLSDDDFVFGRHGMGDGRRKGEIGIHAIRLAEETGDHQVIFGSPGEQLVIRHRAHSREAFASGAIRAVRYVHRREPGLYDIADLLFPS